MKNQKPKALRQPGKPILAKAKGHQLPPDPDGLFERAAARGIKLISKYQDLNPTVDRRDLLGNILFDLMHCCDREPALGNVDEWCVYAIRMYDRFVAENKLMTD